MLDVLYVLYIYIYVIRVLPSTVCVSMHCMYCMYHMYYICLTVSLAYTTIEIENNACGSNECDDNVCSMCRVSVVGMNAHDITITPPWEYS